MDVHWFDRRIYVYIDSSDSGDRLWTFMECFVGGENGYARHEVLVLLAGVFYSFSVFNFHHSCRYVLSVFHKPRRHITV